MALITDLPTNASPALTDYTITDNGSATSKTRLDQLKASLGITTDFKTFSFQVNAGTSGTYTVANNSRIVFFCISTAAALRGLYIAAASSAGAMATTTVQAASSVAITTATNSITFANNASSGTLFVCGIVFNGSIG